MHFGLRTKQVAGVTALVAVPLAALFAWSVALLGESLLQGMRANADLLKMAIYQRTFAIVAQGGDTAAAISNDEGLRNILESRAYAPGVEYAVIVDPQGRIMVDSDPKHVGTTLGPNPSLNDLIESGDPIAQLRAIYTTGSLELRETLTIGDTELGSIRVGVSTLLIKQRLSDLYKWPVVAAVGVLAFTVLAAIFLAGVVLRPIHIIRSGLARLGRGEMDVKVDLAGDADLAELGDSFRQVTARIAADRSELAGQRALESVVDQLEDAVALFAPDGTVLFSNAAMRPALGASSAADSDDQKPPVVALAHLWPAGHPYRVAVERALAGQAEPAPAPVKVPNAGDRLVLTNLVPGPAGKPLGVLLVSRNLTYLTQVESTLKYSRKLATLSRLTAGIAHEIKNPLNAAMIYLELLRGQLKDRPDALSSLGVIEDQVRRLDDVGQTLMKFMRPEELHLQSVDLAETMERLRPVLEAEAGAQRVDLRIDVSAHLPPVEGDPNLLDQAFLNLALNAFQAMPDGGRLRISARESAGRMVTVEVEDTGSGIAPDHLSRIFDLYFTTKPKGSGIGLSLVFRTVQLHDGEIDVQSTVGRGTTFRIQLRQAARMFQGLGA